MSAIDAICRDIILAAGIAKNMKAHQFHITIAVPDGPRQPRDAANSIARLLAGVQITVTEEGR